MIVAHVDLDAFFAAVEELERPELRTRPLVVGGDPRGRGVVATANYIARRYGIHSAMSCAEAMRRCPHAVFVTPRKALYSSYSDAVWQAVADVAVTVERTGLDEGYVDLSHLSTVSAARPVAEAIQTAVRGTTRLSCSLGIGTSKVVAKVASDRRKPGGITIVPAGHEAAFLAPFDIRLLPGIGPRTEAHLRAVGLTALGGLASLTDERLHHLLPGRNGQLLRERARGVDPRPVEEPGDYVSISHEETFERDVTDVDRLRGELERMSARVAERLVRGGRAARTITVKVRYTDFSIRSRSATSSVGTDDGERIAELASALLDRALADRPGALRLVGVAVSNFEPHRQLAFALPDVV